MKQYCHNDIRSLKREIFTVKLKLQGKSFEKIY